MKKQYKITLGNFREDFSIFYAENSLEGVREVKIEADIIKNLFYYLPFFKQTIVVHITSFTNWNYGKQLSLYEYTQILKRVFDFLKKSGYNIILK